MEISELFKTVASNGVWAVLFLFLLLFELKDSRRREEKYHTTLDSLADRLKVVNEIKEDVEKLNDRIFSAAVTAKGKAKTTRSADKVS